MRFFFALLAICSVSAIKGDPSLTIFKSIKGIDIPITSIIIVRSGKNFTLTCKIINGIDNQVTWSKQTKDLKYFNRHNLYEYQSNYNQSKLSFTPIMLNNGGTYVCANFKHNLSTVVPIIVWPKSKRQKRAQFGLGTVQTELPLMNWPNLWKEYLNGSASENKPNKPMWSTQHINGRLLGSDWDNYNLENRPGKSSQDGNWYTSNLETVSGSTFDDFYKKINKTKTPISKNEFGILYCIAIVGGLLLFGGIMCMCIRSNPSLRAQLERSAPNNSTCVHAVCIRNRDTNPSAGCILGTVNTNNSMQCVNTVEEGDRDVTILTFPDETIESNDYNARNLDDVPPSYVNLVHDSKDDDLPPSYEEVLASMQPPTYSTVGSPSSSRNSNEPTCNTGCQSAPLVPLNDL